jgi:hypothetical protein
MESPAITITPVGKPAAERFFYASATILLLMLTIIGFRLFYFHGQAYPGHPLPPPIRTLMIVHGVAMSSWMLFAIVQPLLVATGHRRLHMTLGKIGAAIALVLVALGLKLGIAACQTAPPGLMYGPLTPRQFMAVPVGNILLFALFVSAGVIWRKRPERHRPMMFLASLTVIAAAVGRIDFLNHLYDGTVLQRLFGVFFFTLTAGALLVTAKCILFRKWDPWLTAGFGFMTAWFLLIAQGAPTPAWDSLAALLLR